MNFLAHLYLAGEDEGLRLGAMLGDFVRGPAQNAGWPLPVTRGIRLHRHIDQFVDALPETIALRQHFAPPFRRFAGIILDLAFDHVLASDWDRYSQVPLESFDAEIRELLACHTSRIPQDLKRFMRYADRHGLFAGYRQEAEVLRSLEGVGRRFRRSNPLHRVAEIWQELKPRARRAFERVFPEVRYEVQLWLGGPRGVLAGA